MCEWDPKFMVVLAAECAKTTKIGMITMDNHTKNGMVIVPQDSMIFIHKFIKLV